MEFNSEGRFRLGNKKALIRLYLKMLLASIDTDSDREAREASLRVIRLLPSYYHTYCFNCGSKDKQIIPRGYCSHCVSESDARVKTNARYTRYRNTILSNLQKIISSYNTNYSSKKTNYRENNFYHSPLWTRLRDEILSIQPACQKCGAIENLRVVNLVPVKVNWLTRMKKYQLRVICSSCKKIDPKFNDIRHKKI